MRATALHHRRIDPGRAAAPAVAALLICECDRDSPGVAIPRPEVHLVVRLGPTARGGLDAHAFGAHETARRKLIRGGQRTVTARLHLGAHEAVLGVPASAIAGRIVALEELWGNGATQRLFDELASARDMSAAAAMLASAIAERLAASKRRRTPAELALDAASRLTHASVNDVAVELGVSERHLRRIFREAVGVSPKAFAKLTRFHRALHAARDGGHAGWASIATESGYYDQAHLIADFRAIAGVTPQALLGELQLAPPVG